MAATNSTHPDFPNGTEVVNLRSQSQFFGQRGVVYGSGPSKKRADDDKAVIFVRWPDGEHHAYFPSRLGIASGREERYLVKETKRVGGGRIRQHEIPRSKRGLPTIFQRFNAKTDAT